MIVILFRTKESLSDAESKSPCYFQANSILLRSYGINQLRAEWLKVNKAL